MGHLCNAGRGTDELVGARAVVTDGHIGSAGLDWRRPGPGFEDGEVADLGRQWVGADDGEAAENEYTEYGQCRGARGRRESKCTHGVSSLSHTVRCKAPLLRRQWNEAQTERGGARGCCGLEEASLGGGADIRARTCRSADQAGTANRTGVARIAPPAPAEKGRQQGQVGIE